MASEVTSETYTYNSVSLGNLTYSYDPDGRVVGEGGSFARVNMPPTLAATYTNTDQIATFNGASANSDPASNLTHDPATMATYQWDSRNQLSSVSAISPGLTATYDALSRRRKISSGSGLARSYLHDGSTVVHASDLDSRDMLTIPGSGEILSLSYTPFGSSTNTWVPLHDLNGSTIAHVDSTGSVANSYTYDPNGTPTVAGASIPDPYEFAGMEMDANSLYYAITRYYSPRLVRPISEIGPTNSNAGGGGPSSQPGSPSGSSGFGLSPSN